MFCLIYNIYTRMLAYIDVRKGLITVFVYIRTEIATFVVIFGFKTVVIHTGHTGSEFTLNT